MGLGILEDRHLQHVPGSVLALDDTAKTQVAQAAHAQLKYDRTGKILLVPQPSDDPNDPLVSRRSSSLSLARKRQHGEKKKKVYVCVCADEYRTGRCGNAM